MVSTNCQADKTPKKYHILQNITKYKQLDYPIKKKKLDYHLMRYFEYPKLNGTKHNDNVEIWIL